MTGLSGIARVLDDHRRGESSRDCIEGIGWTWACWCECDWHGPDRDHTEHVAAAVAAWLAERLASEEVREAVVRALYRDVDDFGIDMHEAALTHADAAVAALLAAVRAA